jgi:uncharacterized protein
VRAACVLLLALVAFPAAADFEAGVAAAAKGDYEAARREWEPLAASGHRDAQFNLGLLYENGMGVAADGAKAAYWYEKAAAQNDPVAAAYLAEMHATGLGVPRDDPKALEWYRRAAELGHPASQYNVGLFYAFGRGIAPDDVEAYAWMTVAFENGAPKTEVRDKLARHMSAAHLEEAKQLVAEVRQRCSLK